MGRMFQGVSSKKLGINRIWISNIENVLYMSTETLNTGSTQDENFLNKKWHFKD